MKEYDLSIHTNPDAMAWSKFFREHYPDCNVPDNIMLAWFANAIYWTTKRNEMTDRKLIKALRNARGLIRQMLDNGEWYAPEKVIDEIDDALASTNESAKALRIALNALKYHTAQTRPIHETGNAISVLEETLSHLCPHGVDDGACKECYMEDTRKRKSKYSDVISDGRFDPRG